ncbi:MAG TPA: hypothetical protein IAC38_05045 [Candidatus Caccovivens faecavium]|nr:hypothetical protein [Candidatus Caccovivens faecavium]
MKKKNIVYIISAVIIVLCIIFALLIDVWASFSYFVLSLMTILTLVWAGYLIYNYVTDFKKQLDDDFAYYKAEKINSTSVTSDEFEKNEQAYRKEFNKSARKTKFLEICKIILCFGFAGLFIFAMFVA